MEDNFTERYFDDGSGPAENRKVLDGYARFSIHMDRGKSCLALRASRALRGWATRAPRWAANAVGLRRRLRSSAQVLFDLTRPPHDAVVLAKLLWN